MGVRFPLGARFYESCLRTNYLCATLDRRKNIRTKIRRIEGRIPGSFPAECRIHPDRSSFLRNSFSFLVSWVVGIPRLWPARDSCQNVPCFGGSGQTLARNGRCLFTTSVPSNQTIPASSREVHGFRGTTPPESAGRNNQFGKKCDGTVLNMAINIIGDDMYIAPKFYVPPSKRVWIDVECQRAANLYILPESSYEQFRAGQNIGSNLRSLRLGTTAFLEMILLDWEPNSNFRLIISNTPGGQSAAFYRVSNVA